MSSRLSIEQSARAYDQWLRRQLDGELVAADLRKKHEKMAGNVFSFLRATYWRWAESIFEICPELSGAPRVLAVGDIHLQNFGTWRDVDGRLIWGVNDFDEAAEMPYALDLLRLGVSAVLASAGAGDHQDLCAHILRGYRRGIEHPHAIVLDRDYMWLRTRVVVSEKQRAAFWEKLDALPAVARPPARYLAALTAAIPDASVRFEKCARRTAGAGSLGRPRWIGIAEWRGGPLVREVKRLVPSAWVRAAARSVQRLRCDEIARGRYRAPDPWYAVNGNLMVRRLSPNNRKLDAGDAAGLTDGRLLRAMGHDLASVHLGTGDRRLAIERDLAARRPRWLASAVDRAAAFVRSDFKQWQTG